MDRAAKKHLKELNRRYKLKRRLKKQFDLGIPYGVDQSFLDSRNSRMKNFEWSAYDNLKLRSIIREICEANHEFTLPPKSWTYDTFGRLFKELSNYLFKRHAIVLPYFIPMLGLTITSHTLCNAKFIFSAKILRPETRRTDYGSLYYFCDTLCHKKLWFTTHALDRIKERCGLNRGEIDTAAWLNILVGSPSCVYDRVAINNNQYIRYIIELDNIQCPLLYFPIIEDECGFIIKTTLNNHMVDDNCDIIEKVRSEWDESWTAVRDDTKWFNRNSMMFLMRTSGIPMSTFPLTKR